MMGCDARLGENSPFRQVLSKDVTRWFLKKYVTPETQCLITTKPTKVWITKELNGTELEYDLVFSDICEKNNIKYFNPHIITTELTMYPIVIQTPKLGLMDFNYMHNGKYKLRCVFDPRSNTLTDWFTNSMDMIDIRCKEWIFQNSDKIIGRKYLDWMRVEDYYYPCRGRFLVNELTPGGFNTKGLEFTLRDGEKYSYFDDQGYPSKKTTNKFFGDNYETTGKYKWVKLIITLEAFIISDHGVTPFWKLLQAREVKSPKISPDYGFLSSDEE